MKTIGEFRKNGQHSIPINRNREGNRYRQRFHTEPNAVSGTRSEWMNASVSAG
jgi:hypothetical protein